MVGFSWFQTEPTIIARILSPDMITVFLPEIHEIIALEISFCLFN
jgi:hypothetical protein